MNKPIRKISLISAVTIFYLMCTSIQVFASENKILIINSGSSPPLIINDQDGFYPHLIRELFARLNTKVQLKHMASVRSLKNANQGIDDGVIARVKGIDKKFTHLIRVPEKVMQLTFVAYSNDKTIKIEKWADLKPYNVAYIRGWKVFDKHVTSYKTLVKVKNIEQLFTLLKNKRIDIVLCQVIVSKYMMNQLNFYPHEHKPYLLSRDLFIYMHNKHAGLVPRMTSMLRKLKNEGVYQQLVEKHITQVIKTGAK